MPEVNDIEHYSIFDIDIEKDEPSKVEFDDEKTKTFENFLKRLALNTRIAKSTREAEFEVDSQMEQFILKYISDIAREEVIEKIARKLLKAEKKNSEKIKKLGTEIKKGSLIITIFNIDNTKHLLLSKIDFEKFFERDTFESKLGLPEDKNLLKSCLIRVTDNETLENPLLFDTNGKISQFWRELFLETKYIRDEILNTENAYSALTAAISYVKKKFGDDHRQLKNNIIGYFTTSENYVHEDMIERVIGNYEPINTDLDIQKLKEKLTNLTDKGTFDGSFEIKKSAIKDKIQKRYNLDNDVDLVANAGTHTIYRAVHKNEHYVLIKTKSASDDFRVIKLKE
jgi:hypothetical protein